jgi:hypothetical protein
MKARLSETSEKPSCRNGIPDLVVAMRERSKMIGRIVGKMFRVRPNHSIVGTCASAGK